MKYYKRLPINRKNPTSNALAVQADGTIITDTTGAIQIPNGISSERPALSYEGMIRFNSQLNYFEVYVDNVWGPLQAVTEFNVVVNEFDNGDYADVYFGPLDRNIDVNKPQNVFVYVENVPQIPGYNYTLEYGSLATPITTSTVLTQLAPLNTTTLQVASVGDFNNGQKIAGAGINALTTITATSVTDLTITLSLPTDFAITSGTSVTTTLATGTWVKFSNNSLPVPHKPVFVVTGFASNI